MKHAPVIVCAAELLESALRAGSLVEHSFSVVDGHVYNGLIRNQSSQIARGVISSSATETPAGATVQVIVSQDSSGKLVVNGSVRQNGNWIESKLAIIPLQEQLFSRFKGLHETDDVADKTVLIIAAGSVGSSIIDYLSKLGIMYITIIDPETLGVENIVRHVAGLDSVGRLKVDWAKDHILSKNPYARVETHPIKVEANTIPLIEQLIKQADLVICTIDNREGKQLVNRIATHAGKTVIYSGAFRRAYGAQVLRCDPNDPDSFCYNCFVRALPERDLDQEVSDLAQARALGIHYSDRPAPIQPGLGLDIEPTAFMTAKLALHELLRGKETPLSSLNEDLVAHWYMWLNRREPGTDFENLQPLGFETDDLRILRWYGVEFHRDEHCPVCGNGLQTLITHTDSNQPGNEHGSHSSGAGTSLS
ncbi:MAG: hypothetical protein CML13_06905 [Puniceicoccaceae bacterium]|nr:hypothetical protein [Puniceicoccaceae bacterium]|tara:strand:+ start:9908 stop:11170 length:1263 start_codon:yes stop_codon:yes gene_type:complete